MFIIISSFTIIVPNFKFSTLKTVSESDEFTVQYMLGSFSHLPTVGNNQVNKLNNGQRGGGGLIVRIILISMLKNMHNIYLRH